MTKATLQIAFWGSKCLTTRALRKKTPLRVGTLGPPPPGFRVLGFRGLGFRV